LSQELHVGIFLGRDCFSGRKRERPATTSGVNIMVGDHLRVVAVFAAVIVQAIAAGASLHAQTLTNPNPPTRAPPTTALPENKQPKPCPAYGPGFVQIPGSDVCVKIGGAVQVQGSTH
jgi:hypothetical protein